MTKRQQVTFGIIAGLGFILLYLFLSLFLFRCPTPNQYFALRIVISLGAAAFAAAIPGAISVNYKGIITAGGSIAVFVIVMLLNPPALAGADDCREDKITLTVNIYLNDLPFEFAKVSLVENEDEGYTNSYGRISFITDAPLPEELSIRVKSEAMTIDTVCRQLSPKDRISIHLKRKAQVPSKTGSVKSVQQNQRKSVQNIKSIKIVSQDTVSVKKNEAIPPQPMAYKIPVTKNYCVVCSAKNEKGEIVNQKSKCYNDSLYIVNYILGFTNASMEQNRQAECKWENVTMVSFEELKKEPLAKVLVNFMQTYAGDCFNSARIRDWGGRKRGFTNLYLYSYIQIEQMLEALRRYGVVETGTCSAKELYSFADGKSPDISDFLNH